MKIVRHLPLAQSSAIFCHLPPSFAILRHLPPSSSIFRHLPVLVIGVDVFVALKLLLTAAAIDAVAVFAIEAAAYFLAVSVLLSLFCFYNNKVRSV